MKEKIALEVHIPFKCDPFKLFTKEIIKIEADGLCYVNLYKIVSN